MPMPEALRRFDIAIIGAGWAGCAAAVTAVARGHRVTVYEAASEPGGRARTIAGRNDLPLDNGQHILLGAYRETLALMREVGIEPDTVLQRLPLDLRWPDGTGLALPCSSRFPSLATAWGILRAKGWTWADRWHLLQTAMHWQKTGFTCSEEVTVQTLCASLPPIIQRHLIEPLCLSAFNSPPENTSGPMFLRVIRDALFSTRGSADVLWPMVPLGAVLPAPALQWVSRHGGQVHLASRVRSLSRHTDTAPWELEVTPKGTSTVRARHDRVILACPSWEAARLVSTLTAAEVVPADLSWAQDARALAQAAIATTYVWCPARSCAGLPAMQALPDSDSAPAQFVFHHAHRTRLMDGQPHHLLAFVCSHAMEERQVMEARVLQQATDQLNLTELILERTLMEKRATFVCARGLRRPSPRVLPDLWACGDYVEGPYPATLEGAVSSGRAAGMAATAATDGADQLLST